MRESTATLDRLAVSRDLWPGGTLDMWQDRPAPLPDRVVWPANEGDVAEVLGAASAAGTPVVTYGAGSGVCGGARGMPGAVVLDTKGLDAIGPLDAERRTVDVQAGVNGQHLEDWLNARGYTLGHSPSSIWCSTVGGWAAARGAGQFSSKYGVFEDMVLGLTAVTPGGGVLRVGDGGEDDPGLMELLLGSEGTLGVITRLRLRVWPLPETRWLRGYRFPSVDAAARAMRGLLQGELWPAVVRLYDPVDTRIGGRTKAKVAKEDDDADDAAAFVKAWATRVAKRAARSKRALSLPLGLPSLVNKVLDGVASGCLLVVGWEGPAAVVDAAVPAGQAILEAEGGEDLGAAPGERWFSSRHHVSYKLIPIFEGGGFADTMEVACRWSQLVPLYHAVRAALSRTTVVMAHMSHLYPEGGSIYFSFAGRGDRAVYDATWRAALEAALAVGATVTHHHGVGELKAWAATAEAGPAVRGWKEAKALHDPAGVLNPGRLFVDAPPRAVAERPAPAADDGLVRAPHGASIAKRQLAAPPGAEPMWPWASLPAPPRWQRSHWQTGEIEVAGRVDGGWCERGRGPRSAAGPDLRPWLIARAEGGAQVATAVAPASARWMGEARVERPWAVAQAILRADLRPAVLTVVDGALRVGFRGPAAAAFGAVASAAVPGGLAEVPYAPAPLASGPLAPCAVDDPDVVAVTVGDAWRQTS